MSNSNINILLKCIVYLLSLGKWTTGQKDQQHPSLNWFSREHFAVANALFPEHQFGVNDHNDVKMESRSLPPPTMMRARSHSEGKDPNINHKNGGRGGLDDHGFPKLRMELHLNCSKYVLLIHDGCTHCGVARLGASPP